MTGNTPELNLAVCAASLAGFSLLALASRRQGESLLARMPTRQERLRWRLTGWSLLALALALCIRGWGWSIGAVTWLGWLCATGTALVFALSGRLEKPNTTKKPLASPLQTPRSQAWRALALVLLIGCPLAFAWTLSGVPVKPVARDDAIQARVGPWPFILAEADHDPPRQVTQDIFLKAFQLRFCNVCDADIRSVYLKVNQPRSLRGAGVTLNGARWDRSGEVQFPANTRADSKLWLTVEGKDGTVHQTAVLLSDIAPTTAQWFKHGSNQGKSKHAAKD